LQNSPPPLPTSNDVAQATAHLRAEHDNETSGLQRAVDRLTAVVGLPGFVAALTAALLLWIAGNLGAPLFGLKPLDPPPFVGLEGVVSALALYVAALILTTQRRQDQLAAHREQLILELAIVNDQKTAKIIELLEEVRRDNPMISNRIDEEARAMSAPSDPQSVLGAIKDSQA
jgi:uncharacterized membrane protein